MNLRDELLATIVNTQGKINPWAFRDSWIDKNNLRQLMNKVASSFSDNYTIREKVEIILNYNGIPPKCLICGDKTNYHASIKKFASFCSLNCEHNSPQRKEIGKKNINPVLLKEKFQEKYGMDNYMKVEAFKDRHKEIIQEKYGVDNVSKIPTIKEKLSYHKKQNPPKKRSHEYAKTIYDRHINEKIPITSLSIEEGYSASNLYFLLSRYGYENKIFSNSYPERKIHGILNENNIDFISNSRKFLGNNKELDILIPDHNIAIEVNGLYWHNDQIMEKYHMLNKTLICKEKGIELLHFFDNEINEKFDIFCSILMNKMGNNKNRYYARNTKITELSNEVYKNFCDANHIQGYRPASVKYGLEIGGEIISLMSFSKTGEMVRFCNKLNTSVVGGANKLFKHILKNHKFDKIYTFSDRRFFDGKIYETLGFDFSYYTKPNYYYFHPREYKLHSRLKFQKHKLESLLETYDPNLSEYDNMKNNKWLRIWDCGNSKFVFNKY